MNILGKLTRLILVFKTLYHYLCDSNGNHFYTAFCEYKWNPLLHMDLSFLLYLRISLLIIPYSHSTNFWKIGWNKALPSHLHWIRDFNNNRSAFCKANCSHFRRSRNIFLHPCILHSRIPHNIGRNFRVQFQRNQYAQTTRRILIE